MSMLLVDAGNSRLKWMLCRAGHLSQPGEFAYGESNLAAQLAAHWAALPCATLSKIVLCNVAGQRLQAAVEQWAGGLQETGGLTIETVTAQQQGFGVRCAYRRPQRLGADRWAGLVAARQHIHGACCIIDCGTALTIDVLSANGVHLGGVIVPGRSMMRQSLHTATAQVDVSDATHHALFSVQDTADAVQAGIMTALHGSVTQVLQQCREQGLSPLSCVLTGGDAPALLPVLPPGSLYEPRWVFKGLAVIAGCHQQPV